MLPNPQFPADLVTFTEEILNGKLYFLFSEACTGPSTKFTKTSKQEQNHLSQLPHSFEPNICSSFATKFPYTVYLL